MKRVITPALFLLASTTLAAAQPSSPAAAPGAARQVHVEVTDPGDPAGGAELTTTLLGDRACASSVTDDGTAARKLQVCLDGGAVRLRLERRAGGKNLEVDLAARPVPGKRVLLGAVALGPRQRLEAFVTVD